MDKKQVKIIVIDADLIFQESIFLFLKKIGFTKVLFADSFVKGKILLESVVPDLVLLDTDLKQENIGIGLGLYMRQKYMDLPIIFFTNNFNDETYNIAKEVKPFAFLNKEITELGIRQAVELALISKANTNTTHLESNNGQHKDVLFIKIGGLFKRIYFDEIDYIFYLDRYANIMSAGKSYALNKTMKELSKALPTDQFLQIHQSYIVNINRIANISLGKNEVEIVGKILPIGVSYKKIMEEQLSFLI
jgi:two-component system, LytTR family, response regulator LytT